MAKSEKEPEEKFNSGRGGESLFLRTFPIRPDVSLPGMMLIRTGVRGMCLRCAEIVIISALREAGQGLGSTDTRG